MKEQRLTVTENRALTECVYRMELAGEGLEKQKPGQFVNIRLDGLFLRRPISVYDSAEGRLAIIYKAVGKGTRQMTGLKPGTELDVLTGLGNGYDLDKAGDRPLLLGGGVGVPPLYLLAKQLRAQGRAVSVVLGFNTWAEVFGEEEFKALGCDVTVGWAAASAPAWAAAAKPLPDTSGSAGKARCWKRRRSCGQTDNDAVRDRAGQSGDPGERHLRIRI